MAERLALAVVPGVGWSANEVQTIAREAEEAGFDAIFAAEVNNDVMATAQLMGVATRQIHVGTWIANRSEEHTSELQSLRHLVCRLLLEKKKQKKKSTTTNRHNNKLHDA